MKKITTALLLLTFLLGACSTSPAPAGTDSPQDPAPTTPSANSGQAEAGREAIVSEIENSVSARSTSSEEFAPAAIGMKISAGGGLQTGSDGRTRIDLAPEGSIIRVGPNSSFTLPEITEAGGQPKTTLELFFGKVYVLLNGGSLDVKTPSGVASVRGSLLSVEFNPETKRVRASCLEGYCTLEDEDGEALELTEGQSAYIDEEGSLSEIGEIDQDEIVNWIEDNPDLLDFLDELPNPEDYPDLQDGFDGETEGEDNSTDNGSGGDG